MSGAQLRFWPDAQPLVERLGRDFFRELPESAGVYLMKGPEGLTLYVGKAKNLRKRLASYRVANPDRMRRRHLRLVNSVSRIDCELCVDERAALRRESELLRTLKPKFNRAGVWQGPKKHLAWRVMGNEWQITIVDQPLAGWQVVNQRGGTTWVLQAITRLMWCRLKPGRGLGEMPSGWIHGRLPSIVGIEMGGETGTEWFEELMAGKSASLKEWLESGYIPTIHSSHAAKLREDLEEIEKFFGLRVNLRFFIAVTVAGALISGCKPAGKATTAKKSEQYAGSDSCRSCHAAEFEQWRNSHHGLAERPVSAAFDQAAFQPARTIRIGAQTTRFFSTNEQYFVVAEGLSGKPETHRVERAIGVDPLVQYLVSAPGNRMQTLEVAYDPHKNQWFDVFGDEERKPGEWGHWTGRGMNWNQMCAVCHNTRVSKNYDVATDSYHTKMAQPTVSCEACHGPLKAHNDWQQAHGKTTAHDPTLLKLTKAETMENCGACHSRRTDFTGDFQPGEKFLDHYDLEMAGAGDNYYADGQIRSEDYEYASFLGSKMHHAGISCMDCHNPHSMKTILPGNQLCLRCHNGSLPAAPKIDPVAHSHHQVHGYDAQGKIVANISLNYDRKAIAETGGECVNCHMPQTVYMQRHWRHDHGFTSPDPKLTQEFGIPNACNRCHQDKTADWAEAANEKWFGTHLNGPRRKRAEALARLNAGDVGAVRAVLEILKTDESGYWKAAAENSLALWSGDERVMPALMNSLSSIDPLVRTKAAQGLDWDGTGENAQVKEALVTAMKDPVRSVRLAAAWSLRKELDEASAVGKELRAYLELNADQPAGQAQLGEYDLARGNAEGALSHFRKAVEWDAFAVPLRRQLAVVYGVLKRPNEAVSEMQTAVKLAPKDAQCQFELGLALNEAGNLAGAKAAFGTAVTLMPNYEAAWYNLGLAHASDNELQPAVEALLRAESINPLDPRPPYARATVLGRQEKWKEARIAARRALEIEPNYSAAQEFLDQTAGR